LIFFSGLYTRILLYLRVQYSNTAIGGVAIAHCGIGKRGGTNVLAMINILFCPFGCRTQFLPPFLAFRYASLHTCFMVINTAEGPRRLCRRRFRGQCTWWSPSCLFHICMWVNVHRCGYGGGRAGRAAAEGRSHGTRRKMMSGLPGALSICHFYVPVNHERRAGLRLRLVVLFA